MSRPRVVSLVPSLTESVESAAPGLLVGATDYCVHPADLDVTRIGGSKYPTVADVLALRPDLVVANVEENRAEDVAALRAAGVRVWVSEAPESVPAALGTLAELFADVLAVPAPGWLADATRLWAPVAPERARAVVPVWRRPWVVLGRDTFAGDVLRRLGVANAFGAAPERYPRPRLADLHATLAEGRVDPRATPAGGGAESLAEGRPDLRATLAEGRAETPTEGRADQRATLPDLRATLPDLRATPADLRATGADLVVLPDEPYPFTATDGPEAFPGARHALVSGRLLTWWGPSLVEAHATLSAAIDAALAGS